MPRDAAVCLCGSLAEKQAEELVVAEDSVGLPKGKERYEGYDDHDGSRKNLAATGTCQTVCDLIPAVAMRETLDHVLEHAKNRYEDPEYLMPDSERIDLRYHVKAASITAS